MSGNRLCRVNNKSEDSARGADESNSSNRLPSENDRSPQINHSRTDSTITGEQILVSSLAGHERGCLVDQQVLRKDGKHTGPEANLGAYAP